MYTKLFTAIVISFACMPMFAFADSITFSGASDMTAEATSSAGAYVPFTVTAQDASSTPLSVTCTPASGSLFALGTTSVSCSASDSTFSTSTVSFNVDVVDTTAPTITPPATQYFATSTFPTSPTLTQATATDAVDQHPTITYDPTSFSTGTTTVTWTATDASGNSAATTSLVVFTDSSASTTSATSTATTTPFTLEVHVNVPATCTATDTDAVAHTYTASSSTSYVGICAVEAALASSSLSSVTFSNQYPSLGLFVTSFNGITADPSNEYWALYQNDSFASSGIAALPVAAGDTIQFQLHDFSDNDLGDHVTFDIDSLVATTTATTTGSGSPSTGSGSSSGGGGGGSSTPASFNTAAALSYLSAQQNTDGSFDTQMITDWAALALAAADPNSTAFTKLKRYDETTTPTMSNVTDYERHAIALEALGINPYDANGVDYIAPIVHAYDGTQIGDPSEDNDDIFGLLALASANYAPSNPMMEQVANSVLSQQKTDGSWDESPDLTAAALQVLPQFFVSTNVSPATLGQALGEGEAYLESTQKTDGGWSDSGSTSDIDATSWVQTFINAVALDDPTNAHSWTNTNGKSPLDVLQASQQADGGVRPVSDPTDTRLWSTAYAIVAASGKDWDSLQQSFSKPAAPTESFGGGGGSETLTATSTSATSSLAIATSSPTLATSTTSLSTTKQPIATTTRVIPIPHPTSAQRAAARLQVAHALTVSVATAQPRPAEGIPHATATSSEPASTQVAAAAITPAGHSNFFGSIWHAIASFFSHLF